ncbi:MAG: hypothetical protein IKX86_03725 [Clostridia bacterium]|nr:hypothetical protein [Clostridia bacterium]MBR5767765.1 hypothetical protein [Clostridia bacterium]
MKSKRFLCLLMAAAILILSAASCGEKQTYGDDVDPFEMPTSFEPGCRLTVNRLNELWLSAVEGIKNIFRNLYIYGNPVEYNDYPLAEKMGFDPESYTASDDARNYEKDDGAISLTLDKYGRYYWKNRAAGEPGEEKDDDELEKIVRDFLERYELFSRYSGDCSLRTSGRSYLTHRDDEGKEVSVPTEVTFVCDGTLDGVRYLYGKISVVIRVDGVIKSVTSQALDFASRKRADMISVSEVFDMIEQGKLVNVGGQVSGTLTVSVLYVEYWTENDKNGMPTLQPVYSYYGTVPVDNGFSKTTELTLGSVQANRF